MFLYKLATDLGKTVQEILQMTPFEFRGWAKYYEYVAKQNKKAQNASRGRR
jgi:hypothetical protein